MLVKLNLCSSKSCLIFTDLVDKTDYRDGERFELDVFWNMV